MPATTATGSIFQGPADWASWSLDPQDEEERYKVREYVNPDLEDDAVNTPVEPRELDIGSYEKRQEPRLRNEADDQIAIGERPTHKHELTRRGLALYESDARDYREAVKRYEKHKTAITHIHMWVKSYLAPGQNLLYFGN